jgi:hypothetical protein
MTLPRIGTKEGNLDFDGNGRVSVPVESILRSPNFQRQLAAIREAFPPRTPIGEGK